MESIKKSFGRRLRSLREARGFSRELVAQNADFDPTSLYRVETGKQWIAPETLGRLADFFSVSPAVFFSDDIPVIKPTPREAWQIVGEFIEAELSKKKTAE